MFLKHLPARRGLLLLSSTLALAACGGGGGGGVNSVPTPIASPSPTPAPAPSPTPTPTGVNFDTAEYRSQAGLALSNVLPAYQSGATGAGVTVAVIDSGIAASSPEFAGRISPASTDVVSTRGIVDQGGHGTAVSSILLGARNDGGTHGVAFNATLLALRTDSIGSCTGPQGECTHSDSAIARALDIAVANGAKVANLSLGGDPPNVTLRAAMQRATAAGMVLVISAGNDATADPDPFAMIATDAAIANRQIIIAGAHDSTRAIADFSNRAGTGAAHYLTAFGTRVRSIDETGATFLFSGTSFAAPHIAGAAALLAQAFPNLTGQQIAQLLFESADDLGTTGIDAIFGRGGLNVGRALAPRGSTSLAGSAIPVTLGAESVTLSPAMGDAAQASLGAVMLDGFGRAYVVDLGSGVATARPTLTLSASLAQPPRFASLARGDAVAGLSLAGAPSGIGAIPDNQAQLRVARGQSGFVAGRVDARTSVAFGFGQSGASLAGQLSGAAEPAFLVARGGGDALGFERRSDSAASIRHQLGGWGLTMAAEAGDALIRTGDRRRGFERAPYALVGMGADRRFGPLRIAGGLSLLDESETVLGGRLGSVFGGAAGARTIFADVRADWALGAGWSLTGTARQGWTRIAAGGIASGDGRLVSRAVALDLRKASLFAPGDHFALRVAQPLRVASGGLGLTLPVNFDYGSGAVTYAASRLNLAPTGREVDVEASYGWLLLGGRMETNLFWRRDPGNIAMFPDDVGGAVRWRIGF
jgi:subtilisin family serine protease